jgi:hypothetical protein
MGADTQPADLLIGENVWAPRGKAFFYGYRDIAEAYVLYVGWPYPVVELVQDIKREGPSTHPIPYPYCVDKGCELHPWVL